MDNVSAVAHINRMGGTRSPILLKISREIWKYCQKRGITLTAEYIPVVLNEIADWESRHTESSNNWTLNRAIFQQINKIMGPLKLDLFVDRLNAQLDNYVSWRPDPFAIQTDAFQLNWSNKNPYVFSPFCLIARYPAKVNKERSNLVIITPVWQSQAFTQCYWKCQYQHQYCSLQ